MSWPVLLPKRVLAASGGAVAFPPAMAVLIASRNYRYATWGVVDRCIAESMIFALPLASLLTALLVRRHLDPTLMWLRPSLPRARSLALNTLGSLAAAHAGGVLLGSAVGLGWGLLNQGWSWSTTLCVLAAALSAAAVTGLSAVITLAFPSVWSALALPAGLAMLAVLGRAASTQRFDDMVLTRAPWVPFDGRYLLLDLPYTMNPWVFAVRAMLAVAAGLACWWVLGKVLVRPAGLTSRATAATSMAWLPVLALVAGVALSRTSLVTTVNPRTTCRTGDVTVCVYEQHRTDLPTAVETITRIRATTLGALIPAKTTFSEGAAETRTTAPIAVHADRSTPADLSIAAQVTSWMTNQDQCVTGHRSTPANMEAAVLVAQWMLVQALGRDRTQDLMAPQTQATLRRWAQDPAATNRRLLQHKTAIASCQADPRDLG